MIIYLIFTKESCVNGEQEWDTTAVWYLGIVWCSGSSSSIPSHHKCPCPAQAAQAQELHVPKVLRRKGWEANLEWLCTADLVDLFLKKSAQGLATAAGTQTRSSACTRVATPVEGFGEQKEELKY